MSYMRPVFDLATAIALLSLLVSAITLFLTQFKGAELSHVVGPELKVYYPFDGGFALYLPVTFLNQSARTGTVLKCGITIFSNVNPEERFYMEWREFSRLDPATAKWGYEEITHAIAIPGNGSTVKVVWFSWRANSTPQFRLSEGQYVFAFHYWTAFSKQPVTSQHGLHIDHDTFVALDGYRTNKQSTIVDLVLDAQIASNKLMTSHEAKSLLGI
jgi:hypothetical protein